MPPEAVPQVESQKELNQALEREDAKVDLSKILIKDDKDTPDPRLDKKRPQLVDADAKSPADAKGKDEPAKAELVPAKKPLKERVEDLGKLAARTRADFLAREKTKEDARRAQGEAAKLKTDLEALQAESGKLKAALEQSAADPLEFLEKRGVTPERLAAHIQKATSGHKEDPTTAELREAIAQIRNENKELRESLQSQNNEAKRQAEQAEKAATFEATKVLLIDNFTKSKDKYPHLHEWLEDPKEIVPEFLAAVDKISKHPGGADLLARPEADQEILEGLERFYETKIARFRKAAESPSQPIAEKQPGSEPASRKPKAPQKSQKLRLPDNLGELPKKEADRLIAEYLEHQAAQKAS
jgi:hypothetical protein